MGLDFVIQRREDTDIYFYYFGFMRFRYRVVQRDRDGQIDGDQREEAGPGFKVLLESWNPANPFDQQEKEKDLKLANFMKKCGNEGATLVFC